MPLVEGVAVEDADFLPEFSMGWTAVSMERAEDANNAVVITLFVLTVTSDRAAQP